MAVVVADVVRDVEDVETVSVAVVDVVTDHQEVLHEVDQEVDNRVVLQEEVLLQSPSTTPALSQPLVHKLVHSPGYSPFALDLSDGTEKFSHIA